ncbi:AraC family transcriptional regulator [Nocardia rhizosphaerihabitans]|uniref:AraC family transcriptional regulator n=1 Tax=Nocardia rhizosphaerihabitans TaxID=1691570 RepID=UPI003670C565
MADRMSPLVLSTESVSAQEAFDYWRDSVCAMYVRMQVDPLTSADFHARIEYATLENSVGLSRVRADAQRARRRPVDLQADAEDCVLGVITLDGQAVLEQDGRTVDAKPGTLIFLDSTRPYSATWTSTYEELVVQVPTRSISVTDTRSLTAQAFGPGTVAPVVTSCFTSLFDLVSTGPAQAAPLVPHALGLFGAAVATAARRKSEPEEITAVLRQQVFDFLHSHACDPELGADTVASACGVSRRTLYRIVGGGGVAHHIREIRIDRAKKLLQRERYQSMGAIAAACGFGSESGFHRAFRESVGATPADYRQMVRP